MQLDYSYITVTIDDESTSITNIHTSHFIRYDNCVYIRKYVGPTIVRIFYEADNYTEYANGYIKYYFIDGPTYREPDECDMLKIESEFLKQLSCD